MKRTALIITALAASIASPIAFASGTAPSYSSCCYSGHCTTGCR